MVLSSTKVEIQLCGQTAEDVADAAIRIRLSTGATFGRVWMSRRRRGRDVGLWFCDGTIPVEDLATLDRDRDG